MTCKPKAILERLAELERRDSEKSEEIAKLSAAFTMMQSDSEPARRTVARPHRGAAEGYPSRISQSPRPSPSEG